MEKEESKEIFKIDELNNKYFFAIKMSSKNENKSDLNYWIFNEDYPLHNCALGIICGSTILLINIYYQHILKTMQLKQY